MQKFPSSEGYKIVHDLVNTIQNNKDYLSEVDGAIGDGDHGINMNKGFSICRTKIGENRPNLAESLNTLGKVLLLEIGGSMGPLYGTFFTSLLMQFKIYLHRKIFNAKPRNKLAAQ